MAFVFWLSIFFIWHTFLGYPISLWLIDKIKQKKCENFQNESFEPSITIIIPAHNEEKVIAKKLNNILTLDYPKEKLQLIVASDNSTDNTEEIVKKYMSKISTLNLYIVQERKGKTNAQNEAFRLAKGEIIIFSDANSIIKKNAIKELVKPFTNLNVGYVSGKLEYINGEEFESSNLENKYWNYDLMLRKYESKLDSITAGNGAIYAIRKSDYVFIEPILCHDSIMPIKMALNDKKSKYVDSAVAFEKAGESVKDEFKRKVRMSRKILTVTFSDLEKLNIFRYGLFSYFYFSHRVLRNTLFIIHALFFFSNIFLLKKGWVYDLSFILHILFISIYLLQNKYKWNFKLFSFIHYYCMTIISQSIGFYNEITGKSKPFWQKAESTR